MACNACFVKKPNIIISGEKIIRILVINYTKTQQKICLLFLKSFSQIIVFTFLVLAKEFFFQSKYEKFNVSLQDYFYDATVKKQKWKFCYMFYFMLWHTAYVFSIFLRWKFSRRSIYIFVKVENKSCQVLLTGVCLSIWWQNFKHAH